MVDQIYWYLQKGISLEWESVGKRGALSVGMAKSLPSNGWIRIDCADDARSWHLLPDESESIVEAMFMASIYVELGNGRKALLWTDRWLQGRSISELAPCLCNAVGSRIKKQRTVAQALPGDNWTRDISGALTVQVLLEYLHIWELTRGIQV